MKVWSAIFNIFAIFILMVLLIVYRNMLVVLDKDFQELRLSQAVEYAAEASFAQALQVEDLGMQYEDLDAVIISPGDCLDTFKSLICLSYNMVPSEENLNFIEAYIPVAVLACNDGYYITTIAENDPTLPLKWSLKKPYVIQKGNVYYAVKLHNREWLSVNNNTLEVKSDGKDWVESGGPFYASGLSAEEMEKQVLTEVNNLITKDMAHQIKKRNTVRYQKSDGSYAEVEIPWNYTFYLPSETTKTGVNPIKRPSFLIFMQGVDFAGTSKLDVVSVAGLTTTKKKVIVGWQDNSGKKYYCYEGQQPSGINQSLVRMFDSMEEAARAGYWPNYDCLVKKLND